MGFDFKAVTRAMTLAAVAFGWTAFAGTATWYTGATVADGITPYPSSVLTGLYPIGSSTFVGENASTAIRPWDFQDGNLTATATGVGNGHITRWPLDHAVDLQRIRVCTPAWGGRERINIASVAVVHSDNTSTVLTTVDPNFDAKTIVGENAAGYAELKMDDGSVLAEDVVQIVFTFGTQENSRVYYAEFEAEEAPSDRPALGMVRGDNIIRNGSFNLLTAGNGSTSTLTINGYFGAKAANFLCHWTMTGGGVCSQGGTFSPNVRSPLSPWGHGYSLYHQTYTKSARGGLIAQTITPRRAGVYKWRYVRTVRPNYVGTVTYFKFVDPSCVTTVLSRVQGTTALNSSWATETGQLEIGAASLGDCTFSIESWNETTSNKDAANCFDDLSFTLAYPADEPNILSVAGGVDFATSAIRNCVKVGLYGDNDSAIVYYADSAAALSDLSACASASVTITPDHGYYANGVVLLPDDLDLAKTWYAKVFSSNAVMGVESEVTELSGFTTVNVGRNVGSGGAMSFASDGSGDIVHAYNEAGEFSFTSPSGQCEIRYLVVGGGGASGQSSSKGGGGGAGGEVKTNEVMVAACSAISISVGNGGLTQGTSGSVSSLAGNGVSVTARGGGGAANGGADGGSTPGGGSGASNGNNGGGGGGAGGNASAGTGGPGIKSDITGTLLGYGGGGGGGAWSSAGSGQDGGGNGGGYVGTDGRGGGGGGVNSGTRTGVRGGCGCVILRYTPTVPQLNANVLVVETNCASAKLSIEVADLGTEGDSAQVWLAIGESDSTLPAAKLIDGEVAKGETIYTTEVGFAPGKNISYKVTISNLTSNVGVEYSGCFPLEGMAPSVVGADPVKQADGSVLCQLASAGSFSIVVPANDSMEIAYLLVGGGGAGCNGDNKGGKGGAGGSVVTNATSTPFVAPAGSTVTLTVGAGGQPSAGKGGDSSIVCGESSVAAAGGNGGAGTGGSGNNGAGGSGAGGAATDATGGPGVGSDFTGTYVTYGGGGGGGAWNAAGAGRDGGGNGGGYGGTCTGTDGRGGGGGGAYQASSGFRGGCGFAAIRYTPSTTMTTEPYGLLNGVSVGDDLKAVVDYRVTWAGEGCDYCQVEVLYGLDDNSLTGTVMAAESVVGSGSCAVSLPLISEERTFYLAVRLTSDSGTYTSAAKAITMPRITGLTSFAPIVNAKARTLAFSGTVGPFGVGTTTLTLYYGRSVDNLTEEVILASGADGDDAVEFTSEAITCGKPVRMPEVFYKLVLEEIYNGNVVQRGVLGPKKVHVYTPGLVVIYQ